jgi:hypothetical protein
MCCCHLMEGARDGERSQVEPYAGTNAARKNTNVPEDRFLFVSETACVASASSHPLEVARTIQVDPCSRC